MRSPRASRPWGSDVRGARRSRASDGAARGFTLPLTIVLTFSLMSLAAGVVGLSISQERAARRAMDAVDTMIALESASEIALLSLRRDGVPQAPAWREEVDWAGRTVVVDQFATAYKLDINKEPQALLAAASRQPEAARLAEGLASILPPPTAPTATETASSDLRQRLDQAASRVRVSGPLGGRAAPEANVPEDVPLPINVQRLTDLVARLGGDAVQEDCLRMLATLGRDSDTPLQPETPAPLVIPRQPLLPGQVIELRVATRDGFGRGQVLWRRVRYFGAPRRVFGDHDWRRLTLARTQPACQLPAS